VLARLHLVAPENVDGAAPGDGHQPCAGIGWHARPWPFGEGDNKRVLRQLLCTIDVAHDAGKARDEARPFNAKGRFYCAVGFACHTAFSINAAGEASWRQRMTSG
jgi:hypothetical protein